jgi:AcrR family transcriptional regulator
MSRPGEVPHAKAPQRRNGKLRVAAILKAGAAVISEKGYEMATMAEIAARSNTKIGSLYRFPEVLSVKRGEFSKSSNLLGVVI